MEIDPASMSKWRRRTFEIGFWIVTATVMWTFSALTVMRDYELRGVYIGPFHVITNEASSGVAALIMVAFVVFWLDRVPLDSERPLFTLAGHTLGTFLFSGGHVGLMILMRRAIYAFRGMVYDYGGPGADDWVQAYFYEYRKDLLPYFVVILVLSLYQHLKRVKSARPTGTWQTDKIAVDTRDGKRLIGLDEVEWIQAASNYVNIYTGQGCYLIRSTLTQMEKKLPDRRFARVHRGHIVNLEKITELTRTSSGDSVLHLASGKEVPVSRRRRAPVDEALKGSMPT